MRPVRHRFLRRLRTGLFLLAVGGLSACAHRGPEQRSAWMASRLKSKLDLTKEQSAKLDAVRETFIEVQTVGANERAKHLDEVKQMILSEHLDSDAVKRLLADRQRVIDENYDRLFTRIADFHASLRPEQKQKAVALLEKFSNHR